MTLIEIQKTLNATTDTGSILAIVDALADDIKPVDTEPCVDCGAPVWYCDTDDQYYHTDADHSCFLANGKAPQVTQ